MTTCRDPSRATTHHTRPQPRLACDASTITRLLADAVTIGSMRFPDEDAYDEAGAITRLWYKIICPFTFGARLWMVTASILCALGACSIVCVSVFCLKGLMHDE